MIDEACKSIHRADPTVLCERMALAVALFHELVHGQHIMAGDWKNGGDPRDPATPSGKEEVRAMRYENGVRQDHNLPLRTQYAEVPPPDEESRAPSVNSGFTSVHTDPSVVWD